MKRSRSLFALSLLGLSIAAPLSAQPYTLGGNAFGNTSTAAQLGTTDGKPLDIGIGDGHGIRLIRSLAATGPGINIVGGSVWNAAQPGAHFATISGGWDNKVGETGSFVGGGMLNNAYGYAAAIPGGANNSIAANVGYAVIAGGTQNGISDDADYGVIGGGSDNSVWLSRYGTIGGGYSNILNGYAATIPGGTMNRANGGIALAAGRAAYATHNQSFVWNAYGDGYFGSTEAQRAFFYTPSGLSIHFGKPIDYANNQTEYFIEFGTPNGLYSKRDAIIHASNGARLTRGGAWVNTSDRASKAAFQRVDTRSVLKKLVSLPVTTWSYLNEAPSIRRMGPVAQEFFAAFGLGDDEKSISTVDASGVAFAAIQGLHGMVAEKDREIAALRARLKAIEQKLGL
jgi:trimeric autotransporter adhesin